MKKLIIAIFATMPLLANSQQLHYGCGGTIYNSENKKVAPQEVRELLVVNTKALDLYKKTWGNSLFYGGLALVTTNVIIGFTVSNTTSNGNYDPNNPYSSPSVYTKRTNMTMAIIGGGLIVASIPIKIGYPKKIKKGLDIYNNGLVDNYKSNTTITLIASNDQFGVRIGF
jgi:hypothetical protein